MTILFVSIGITILLFIIIDSVKLNREIKRCPKCSTITKQKFNWDYKKTIVDGIKYEGTNTNVKIYTCQKCGYGWNITNHYSEENV